MSIWGASESPSPTFPESGAPNPRRVWGISRQNILYSSKNLGERLRPITAWGSSRGVERGMLRVLRQSGPEKRMGYLPGSWLRQQPFGVHWGVWSWEGGWDTLWDLTLPIERSPVISRLTQAQHLTPSFRVRVAREKNRCLVKFGFQIKKWTIYVLV